MAIVAGYNAKIYVSGGAVSFTGEATTGAGDTVYQITDTAKQVLSPDASINVHLRSTTGNSAEAGTTTTNITITGHGLSTGDLIYNTTRSAARVITYVDPDNFTVAAVASQTSGDSIDFYPTEATTAYTLNRLLGSVTYASATSRVIRISGYYLPMTEAAQAREMSVSFTLNNEDATVLGNTWMNRKTTTRDFSLSISNFYADETYSGDLTGIEAGNTAEAGTSTTNITITNHGLHVGDVIKNRSRSDAERTVTAVVDDDNFTVASVASQTTGDTIDFYRNTLDPIVAEIWIDRNASYWIKAWVVPASNEVSSSPSSLIEESLEYEGTNDADNRAVSMGTGV